MKMQKYEDKNFLKATRRGKIIYKKATIRWTIDLTEIVKEEKGFIYLRY